MPVKMSISQAAFDEVVKENIEDLDMGKEEALKDAIEQFKSQGADLSMVDTSSDGVQRDTRASIVAHIETLRQMEASPGEDQAVECMAVLSALSELCNVEEDGVGERNKTTLGQAGGVGVIALFLTGRGTSDGCEADSSEGSLLVTTLSTLKDACRNHERNRDAFLLTNMVQVNRLILRLIEHRDVVATGLRLVRAVCTKAEDNKGAFIRQEGALVLTSALQRYGSGETKDAAVIKEACGALRSVAMGDDRRKDFSGTYDNVKTLVMKGAIELLLDTAREFEDDASTVSWVFLALKQLAANDESVKRIIKDGGLELVCSAVLTSSTEVVVCRAGLSLFRNVCANDALKTKLLNEGGLRLILGCMHQHRDDKALQEHGCATMAVMALRSPTNGTKIVQEGGVAAVVEAMRRHPEAQALQRHGCLCIRNIAARGPSLRQAMLDEGCEAVVRDAGKFRGCVDEAYGALRDLRCEVGLVTLGEGGEVQVGVKAFGEQKANFNPVVKETGDVSRRVQESATAPTHAGYLM